MTLKKFISQSGWFTLDLPEDWQEYDDGEKDTYSFFNSKAWTGNLRITPFRWENVINPNEDKALSFVEEEVINNSAQKIKLNEFDCAHYKKYTSQNNEDLIIYYWVAGKNNTVFICSFTTDRDKEAESNNQIELVENIIRSIHFSSPHSLL